LDLAMKFLLPNQRLKCDPGASPKPANWTIQRFKKAL
jgi:hypothetical protein